MGLGSKESEEVKSISNAGIPPGKSAKVTAKSAGSFRGTGSPPFIVGGSGTAVACGAAPAFNCREASTRFCGEDDELLLRRRFVGGAALACGVACDTRCDRSHSKVHCFLVFSQFEQAAKGPKTSGNHQLLPRILSARAHTHHYNGTPLGCFQRLQYCPVTCLPEWPRRTHACLSDTGRNIGSASYSFSKTSLSIEGLEKATSTRNQGKISAAHRRNS